MWKIKCYMDSGGRSDVQSTYDKGTDALRATLENALEYLKVQQRQHWVRPRAAKLNKAKKFRDFYEIRFKADNVQQRPIGYFGPEATDFTILIWATEKGNSLKPASWHTTAMHRMKEIKDGTSSAKDFQLDCEEATSTEQKGVSPSVRPGKH